MQNQLQEIMKVLIQPEFYRNTYIALYNDLLILKNIIPSLPGSFYPQLSKELDELNQRIQSSTQKGGIWNRMFGATTTPISLEIILKMLQTVDKKNALLEDFLACSGYRQKEMTLHG